MKTIGGRPPEDEISLGNNDGRRSGRPDWFDSKLFPFDDKWITIDGHQIHYVDEGPRGAPVMLFVPPGAGWSFTYRYHIQHLRDDFRCIALDLPGYGLSEAAEGYGFTLLEQSHVLERFVEALDLRNIVAWGNDAGGPTAVLALAQHADRVVGLVVGGTFGWSLKEYPMVARGIRLVSGPVFRAINRYTNFVPWSMGSRLALGTRSLPKVERQQYTRPFKDRRTRNRTLKLYRSFNDPATQQELSRSLPAFRDKAVLIQFGDRDPMKRQGWHERWAREIPNNRVQILPGVAHFTFEGAPEATVQNFRDWWAAMKQREMRWLLTPNEYPRRKWCKRGRSDMTDDDYNNSAKARGVPFFVPILNPVIRSMVRMGVPMGPMALLTVRGRKTGKRHTTPVGLLEYDGHQYVFGTFGEAGWVQNLRTAGEATVTRGRQRRSVVAVELPTREAAPVLRNVLTPFFKSRMMSQFLRMGYDLKPDSTMDDFLEEARRHPGFELLERLPKRGQAVRVSARNV